jgi:hypothetical protein
MRTNRATLVGASTLMMLLPNPKRLMLGYLLARAGVRTVVLEKHSREYVLGHEGPEGNTGIAVEAQQIAGGIAIE